MRSLRTYSPLLLPLILLCCGVCVIYPYCHYYIDPDATAYLTISKRYAAGDFAKAINGYWSPWSCWLTAILIRAGVNAIPASVIINMIGAAGVLFVTRSFFVKYRIAMGSQMMLGIALSVFLIYAVYYQDFDDLWECFFLLYALRIIISHRFKYAPQLWVGAGIAGACAYFAKAYAFPFFIVSAVCLAFHISRAWHKRYAGRWLLISLIMTGVLLLISFPWIYLLHEKYGRWMTGTAGTLNMSWYLVGHPEWKAGLQHLLPPVYNDSPSYWEDPWMANGITPHFWDSGALLIRQLMKLVQNSWKFIISSMQISVAFILVLAYVLKVLFRKPERPKYRVYYPVIIALFLFPLPFFLINFEPRYIWYMLPLSMLLGAAILQKNRLAGKQLFVLIFAASYMVWPARGIYQMWNDGKKEFEIAQQLKMNGIAGSFTANLTYGDVDYISVQRTSYFAGLPFYTAIEKELTFPQLLVEMRRYHIRYLFYYERGYMPFSKSDIKDDAGVPFPATLVPGAPFTVFTIAP